MRRGSLPESAAVLTKALSLDSQNAHCFAVRGMVYGSMANWANVKKDTMTAVQMEPLCLLPRIYFIKSCLHLNELYTAWLCLSESISLFPHSLNLSHIWKHFYGCFNYDEPMDPALLSPDLLVDPCLDFKLESIEEKDPNNQVQFVQFARVLAPIVDCESCPPPLRFFD